MLSRPSIGVHRPNPGTSATGGRTIYALPTRRQWEGCIHYGFLSFVTLCLSVGLQFTNHSISPMGLGISLGGLCLPARRDIRHALPQLSPLPPLVSTPSSRMQPGHSWVSSNTALQHSRREVSHPTIVVDSTLAQLPFSCEFEELDGRSSAPTPSSVCQPCWDWLFVGHFGLPCQAPPGWAGPLYRRWPKSVSYTTSSPELRSRALAGCVWCQLVAAQTKSIDNLADGRIIAYHGAGSRTEGR